MADLKDWKIILDQYKYHSKQEIIERITKKGPGATAEDKDILNQIGLWKADRIICISNGTISLLNKVAEEIKTPAEALSNSELPKLISDLVDSEGVGLPMASTILNFYNEKAFPIIDARAYRQVYGGKADYKEPAVKYIDYIGKCNALASEHGIPFEKVDQVLYQKDILEGNKLNVAAKPKPESTTPA